MLEERARIVRVEKCRNKLSTCTRNMHVDMSHQKNKHMDMLHERDYEKHGHAPTLHGTQCCQNSDTYSSRHVNLFHREAHAIATRKHISEDVTDVDLPFV